MGCNKTQLVCLQGKSSINPEAPVLVTFPRLDLPLGLAWLPEKQQGFRGDGEKAFFWLSGEGRTSSMKSDRPASGQIIKWGNFVSCAYLPACLCKWRKCFPVHSRHSLISVRPLLLTLSFLPFLNMEVKVASCELEIISIPFISLRHWIGTSSWHSRWLSFATIQGRKRELCGSNLRA